jgi:predicted DsbA family dithiol-disulfide isomerase
MFPWPMPALRLDIWSDIACPWCYVGKRRLERALERLPRAEAVTVHWHSFELDPRAPLSSQDGTYADRLARKYGTSTRDAQQMIENMVGVARAEGLDFNFDVIRPGNTFDAHRLLHFASGHALQGALKERLFRAYFCEGKPMSDRETLAQLAAEVGLDVSECRRVLASNSFELEVRADESQARALGINGVPFFVVGEKFGVSGAQPAEVLLEVFEKACESPIEVDTTIAEGAACGKEGC